jgi:glycosyltransferase involved in cell wall biosynthesis
VKYLPDFGIEPIVYIPENPTYPLLDENLVKEVSDKVIIIKQPIFEPYGLASFLSKNKTKKISSGIILNKKKQSFVERTLLWIRGNMFIPDARIFWVKPSIKILQKYIQENNIETIITTGPPHSVHLIGLGLKKQNNIQWIADFRDPWTTIGYHKALKLSKKSAQKHKDLEKEVMNSCDQLIVTSPTTKTEFKQITSKPIEVITNGYDIENVVKKPMDSKFTLAHIGSFLSERNPRILWKSLSELIKENKDFANDFQLKLIGAVSKEVLETIKEFRLENYVNHLGYVSHDEALQAQRSSQVLLLIEIDSEDTNCIIPGKLFEYMVSERPILAIGPEQADFKNIIKETNTGTFFTYQEKEALKSQIETYYNQFKENTLKVNAIGLQKYSRKKLTEHLTKLITHNS